MNEMCVCIQIQKKHQVVKNGYDERSLFRLNIQMQKQEGEKGSVWKL